MAGGSINRKRASSVAREQTGHERERERKIETIRVIRQFNANWLRPCHSIPRYSAAVTSPDSPSLSSSSARPFARHHSELGVRHTNNRFLDFCQWCLFPLL